MAGGSEAETIILINQRSNTFPQIMAVLGNWSIIDAALRRITQDRFGVCETCGSPISKARLEALPWTPLCRDCMEQEQSAA